MKIILCAYNWTGCKAIEILLSKGHELFVYTHESTYHTPSVLELCEKFNIKYTTKNISKSTLPFKPDIICSIYYRYIIKESIIDICNGKIFNLHPSLLPKYKGCSSLTWAMIKGEKETGFSFHYIDKGIDTGKILYQQKVPIESFDTQETLYNKIMFFAMEHFLNIFNKVVNGDSGYPQATSSNDSEMYFSRGCPHNGEINDSWDDSYTERFIRAMIFPPLPTAKYKKNDIWSFKQYLELKK